MDSRDSAEVIISEVFNPFSFWTNLFLEVRIM